MQKECRQPARELSIQEACQLICPKCVYIVRTNVARTHRRKVRANYSFSAET